MTQDGIFPSVSDGSQTKEFGGAKDKRSHTSGSYSGTSSRGRGFSAKSFRPSSGRPIQVAIRLSKGGYSGRGNYSSGQGPWGYSQISSGHKGYYNHSRSTQQMSQDISK
ncbi:hypothetical protein HAX54_000809 [Datura stramonium]|uniref:Uncharacterized protein n=1 Tax=Datura stramonium TaxID=4076 RepID=A0ABS8WUB7_DATST|nr:hypothetical protein [Datura stramonium]